MKIITKYIAIITIFCLGTLPGMGQIVSNLFSATGASVERFEGEVFGGLALQLGESEYGSKKAGFGFGAELRYNLPTLPVGIGLQASHTKTHASFQGYRLNSILVTSDWNFGRGSMLTPFAGLGAGIAWSPDYSGSGTFSLKPRIGVEFNDWLRLSLSSQLCRTYYHNMQVSLGLVLGGRRKIAPGQILLKEKGMSNKSMSTIANEPMSAEALQLYNLTEQKYKYQRRSVSYGILGGASLGLGAFLTTSGIIVLSNNHNGNTAATFYGAIFTGAGGLLTLGSVPLFIACGHQRAQAAKISATIAPLTQPTAQVTPGIGLYMTF